MNVSIVTSISEVSQESWDELVGHNNPFVEHAFLSLLETSGSVGVGTGWEPAYVLVKDNNQRLLGAAPAYIKMDSYGEYIFDWMWANVADRLGVDYYPKIVVAVPFTPATGPRLLVHPSSHRETVWTALSAGLQELRKATRASSVHILFCLHEEALFLQRMGFIHRYTHQFHWRNHHYHSFGHYLECLKSVARKQIRKERRTVQEAGISVELITGDNASPEQWQQMYRFYMSTGSKKWGTPYLTRSFFQQARDVVGHRALLGFARQGDAVVAGTLSFEKGQHLYGRYWGSLRSVDCLHFELCYYQLIEHAIQRGYSLFEAGAQGEHKIKRGFLPVITHSVHDMAHPVMRSAFAAMTEEENRSVEAQIQQAQEIGPFREETMPPYLPIAGQEA